MREIIINSKQNQPRIPEQQEIPNSSRSIEPESSNQNKIKLPVLKLNKSRNTGEASKTPERTTVKVPKIRHFKNFSEDLDKKMSKAILNPLETIRFNTLLIPFLTSIEISQSNMKSYLNLSRMAPINPIHQLGPALKLILT